MKKQNFKSQLKSKERSLKKLDYLSYLLALCFERSFFLSQVPPSLPPLSADYASWLCRSPAAAAAAGYFPLNPSNLLAARLAGK